MIVENIERPDAQVVAGFKDLLRYDSVTCAISDCMGHDDVRNESRVGQLVGVDDVSKNVFAYQTRAVERSRSLSLDVNTSMAGRLR